MGRYQGIGRQKKRRAAPLADADQNAPKVPASEPSTWAKARAKRDALRDWIRLEVMDVISRAVDIQHTRNVRFLKYAAMTSACAEALRCAADRRAEQHLEWAWEQANAELASCCTDPPYSAVSPRFRCDACGWPLCSCTCKSECTCGQRVAKRSWRYDLFFFDICRCREPRRFTCDWARFDLRPRPQPD